FLAQVPHLVDVPWAVYPLVPLALAIIVLLPRWTTAVPAPLVAIVVLTLLTTVAAIAVPTVGHEGELPRSLPTPLVPDGPPTFEPLRVIAPCAFAMARVGRLEPLPTPSLVDDVTGTRSKKSREAWGQGVANVVTGLFGGMGGGAMIGQTMVDVKVSGARTRLS